MPAKSKAQLRFMAGVASGSIKKPRLSRSKASEWVHATPNVKSLPKKVKNGKTSSSPRKG